MNMHEVDQKGIFLREHLKSPAGLAKATPILNSEYCHDPLHYLTECISMFYITFECVGEEKYKGQ